MKPGYKQTEVGVIPEEWEVKSLSKWGQSSLFDINRIYREHISFGERTFGSAFRCTMQDSCR